MEYRFNQHYELAEARSLLPYVEQWLAEIAEIRKEIQARDEALSEQVSQGHDLGGEPVDSWVKQLAEMKRLLLEFQTREIQLRDLDRGLIDFPALKGGREIFFCWELGEDDIHYWHDIDSGYTGRQPL